MGELKLIIKKIKRKDAVNKWMKLILELYVLLNLEIDVKKNLLEIIIIIISTYKEFINLEKEKYIRIKTIVDIYYFFYFKIKKHRIFLNIVNAFIIF